MSGLTPDLKSFDPLGGAGDAATYLTGFIPQYILGDFLFSLNTAAPQSYGRSKTWRWAKQERVGRLPAVQFLGPGDDTWEFAGIIFTTWRGGAGQPENMRRMAGKGVPLDLIDALGTNYGQWCIESVDERGTEMRFAGTPMRQEFTIKLFRYSGGERKTLLDSVKDIFR